ncbi:SLOG family protein [Kitasatospora sp. NPDC001603]|uniref:SLOG family protein n=1 Tax=Kitasatospora sp. NPDC001603 TaxID=3154388 RepID=UPI00332428C3
MHDSRVLVCGSRRWPWPDTIHTVLDRLATRHDTRLVIIEGAATGADRAAHRWCTQHALPAWRHRCYPTAWDADRARRPHTWHTTTAERHLAMLLDEEPGLVIAFHEDFNPTGETGDTCLKALLLDTAVWLVPTASAGHGQWLTETDFPPGHTARCAAHIQAGRARQTLSG